MKSLWLALSLGLQLGLLAAPAASAPPLLRLDPSLDALVATDARLETLFQADTIFEGPTWISDRGGGFLVFSDVPGDVIDRLGPDGRVSVLADRIFRGHDLAEAHRSSGRNAYRMVGANGTTLDPRGRLVYCAFSDGEIVRIEKDGRRTLLASHFAGRRLNAPNDLVYKSDGSLYFTDSRAGTRRADGEGVPHKGLYVLRNGRVSLLSKAIHHPNGLAFSPDEKHLYVGNTLLRTILRFDVRAGHLSNPSIFVDMSADPRSGGPDGLKVDRAGNVYSTGPGGIWILSPSGRHVATISTPGPITNLAFGGEDGRMLYITGLGALYRLTLKKAGK